MLIIDDLLQGAYSHWRSSHLVHFQSLLLLVFLLRLKQLLVFDELFLHQQVVLHSLLPKQPKSTLAYWHDSWKFVVGCFIALFNLLPSNP